MIKGLENIYLAGKRHVGAKAYNLARCWRVFKNEANVKFSKSIVFDSSYYDRIICDNEMIFNKKQKDSMYECMIENFENTKVIVRSSAEKEDSKFFSCAGQYDSFLNISGYNDFVTAVEMVYRSSISKNAATYLDIYDMKKKDNMMAILVQEMIDIDCSGVMYTRNPIDREDDEILIEASFEAGDKIASGEINSETIFYSRIKGNNEDVINLKNKQFTRLCLLADKLENEFGCPLDIEWGFKGEYIYIFQVRPMFFCINDLYADMNGMDDVLGKKKGIVISSGISMGVLSGNWILTSSDRVLANSIDKIIDCSSALITTGGRLSHFSSIMREMSKPCILFSNDDFGEISKYDEKIVINGYLGEVYFWGKLNSKQKAYFFLETIYHFCKYGNKKTHKMYGIESIECSSKIESVCFGINVLEIEKQLNDSNWKRSEYSQDSLTFDYQEDLIDNNIVVREQKKETKYVKLQVKKLYLGNKKYRSEMEMSLYFKREVDLQKFVGLLGLVKTGCQQRKVVSYEKNNTRVNVISWPNAQVYLGIETVSVEMLYEFIMEFSISESKLHGFSGKKIFEYLSLDIERCNF